MNIVVAGLGDLGGQVARRLVAGGHQVTGLRQSDQSGPTGVQVIRTDLRRPLAKGAIPDADRLVICLSPAERTPQGYRQTYVTGARHLLRAARFQRVLLVSSSSVWGGDDGHWVDEATPANPAGWRGEVLLAAEREVTGGIDDAVVLRLAGLYGPGRHALIRQVWSGAPIARANAWSNRIHRDDAAALVCHLLDSGQPAGVHVGVDERPARRDEVVRWLAQIMHRDLPPMRNGSQLGKRLRQRRPRGAGFALAYADYRAGYSAERVCAEIDHVGASGESLN